MAIETLRGATFEDGVPYYCGTVVDALFPPTVELVPQTNQLYELDLAWGEFKTLSEEELVERGAYFKSVGGSPTHHYEVCLATPNQVNPTAAQARKHFFEANMFAVGYATHGLFPYRGKFHPQMVKAVMNIMGLKPGDTVLDPMVGCGTVCIEASITGINSIGIEPNPFACLMSRAKLAALDMNTSSFEQLRVHADEIAAELDPGIKPQPRMLAEADVKKELNDDRLRQLLLLCYLDAMGYALRRKNKTARTLFPELLQRYLEAVRCFNDVRKRLRLKLGRGRVIEGDARDMTQWVPAESVDGIVFSPPYSFAIDYLDNDRTQLEFMGVDVGLLKERMIGLRLAREAQGTLVERKVSTYFEDMDRVLGECSRVLKPGRCCVVVVGSNTNQTGGVFLEDALVDSARRHRMLLFKDTVREIEGIRNTMRDEHLLFFMKL